METACTLEECQNQLKITKKPLKSYVIPGWFLQPKAVVRHQMKLGIKHLMIELGDNVRVVTDEWGWNTKNLTL